MCVWVWVAIVYGGSIIDGASPIFLSNNYNYVTLKAACRIVLITEPADSPSMECRLQTVSIIYNTLLIFMKDTLKIQMWATFSLFCPLICLYYVHKFPRCAPAPHVTLPLNFS